MGVLVSVATERISSARLTVGTLFDYEEGDRYCLTYSLVANWLINMKLALRLPDQVSTSPASKRSFRPMQVFTLSTA
jgi:hypothetical protein